MSNKLICDEAATIRENTYLVNFGQVTGYLAQGNQLTLTGPQPMTFMGMTP
jgi:hypothetical protein